MANIMQKQPKKYINIIELLLAALVWGVAFVAQSEGIKYVGSNTFNACRFILGGLVLIPVILIFDKNKRDESPQEKKKSRKTLFTGGIICGMILCLSSTFQQIGIAMGAPVGKAGFLTALYIILVPIAGLFIGKKNSPTIWACVCAAAIGMYFLCVEPASSFFASSAFSLSEVLLLLCAVGFTFHILSVDKFSPLVSGIKLSCIQFFTAGVISTILMFIFEKPTFSGIFEAALPIMYAGIMSCGVAYTLQIIGQKNFNPAIASLILSLESVFSVLAGFVLLGETLSPREITGCVIIFASIVIVQIPFGSNKK